MINFVKKYINDKNEKIYIFLLIVIAIISHINWFSFRNIIDFGDQIFFHAETFKEFSFSFCTWMTQFNIGSSSVQLFNFPIFGVISSFLANINIGAAFIFNITFLIPIAILGFLSPYILVKKLVNNNVIAFVAALFYGSATSFLVRQNSQSAIAFIEAMAPLIFYFFILALEKNEKKYWLYFIFIYCIGIFYEIRMIYLISFIFLLYFIVFYFYQINKYWKNIIIFAIIAILLNIFWLFPILAGSASSRLDSIINRPLSNNFQYNIINAFSIFNYQWTEFTKVSLCDAFYFWFAPIISFFSLLCLKSNKKYKKEVIFFAIISLVGIIITKQADRPFTNLFPWLRNNIPGFMMFRDSYKFYFIICMGYLGLLSYTLLFLKNNKLKIINYLYYLFVCLICAASFLNLLPFIEQKLDLNKTKTVQTDYLIFKDFVINQKDFFRSMEVPRRFRWMVYTVNHPSISLEHMLNNNFSDFYNNISMLKKDRNEKDVEIFKKYYSSNFLDILSTKYVLVPPRDFQYNRDIWEIFYDEKRQFYIDELDKQNYLKKIDIGTEELVVYENENYRPHIYTTKEEETIHWEVPFEKVDFVQKNPTEYKISLKNLSKKTYLNFSESFHPDWKLRTGEFGWFSVLIQKDYFLPDEFHIKNNANLSTFKIDPEFVKKNYPNSYTENPDGSINVDLTLFFKPQSYFYLGLLISSETLLICLLYLGYCFLFKIPQKEEEKLIKKDGTTIKKIQ